MTDTSRDPALRAFLAARQEIREPDRQWWIPWAGKAKTLRALRALFEFADQLNTKYETLREKLMNQDRELYAAVIAGLSALGPAIDSLVADRDSWKSRAQDAEGQAFTDEQEDVAAAQPAKDLVDALLAKVTPAAPDVAEQPVPSPQEATEVVNAAPDPDDAA